MTDILRGPTPSGSPLAVPSPHLLPPPLRPPSVDLHALDDDPVDVPGLLHGEVLVPDVREDALGIPLQRRAPSAASPAAKADLLAPDEFEPSDLAGDHRLPAVLEDDAGVRRPVGPAVDAPGRVLGAADAFQTRSTEYDIDSQYVDVGAGRTAWKTLPSGAMTLMGRKKPALARACGSMTAM